MWHWTRVENLPDKGNASPHPPGEVTG